MAEERKSYWDSNGKYQAVYDELWEEFVPASGESENEYGELIRIVGRLFYEYCNNGNCNAAERDSYEVEEDCYDCRGDGEIYNDLYDEDDPDSDEPENITCPECLGDGYRYETEYDDLQLDGYYGDMIASLQEIPELWTYAQKVEELVLDESLHYNYNYDQKEMDVYNALVDRTVEYVMEKLGRSLEVTN